MYCVYFTIYKGNKLPKRYIGSSSVRNVTIKNYNGSVTSSKYGHIFKDEQLNNKHLFKTRILSIHETDIMAREEELRLQIKYDVVKSPFYMNESFAKVNGFFGMDVSGDKNPMFGKSRKGEKHKGGENISKSLLEYFQTGPGIIEKQKRSARFSGDKNPMFGKKHSKDRNIVQSEKMKKHHSLRTSPHPNSVTLKGKRRCYHNGITTIMLCENDEIPHGFVIGKHYPPHNKKSEE